MALRPGDTFAFFFDTYSSTGYFGAPDSTPTGVMRRNGVVDAGVTITITPLATGKYKATGTIPIGYSSGDICQVDLNWLVSGNSTGGFYDLGILDARRISDISDANGYVTVVVNNDKTAYSLTATERNNLALVFWTYLVSAGSAIAGSFGKLFSDNLNATVSSRSSHSAADVWTANGRTLSTFDFTVNTNANSAETDALAAAQAAEAAAQAAAVDTAVIRSDYQQRGHAVTLPSIAPIGYGGTAIVRQVLHLGETTIVAPLRFTAEDTGFSLSLDLVAADGEPVSFGGAEPVTFTMRLKGSSGTAAIDAADGTLTPQDRNGIRAAQFDFTGEIPVPAAGFYVATFNVSGVTYPIGRQLNVIVQEAL